MNGMIALIAHDGTKDEMLALAEEFRDLLDEEAVVATATTGSVLRCELELDVRCVLSGPLGGDLQIGSMVAGGFVKLVIFLRDPLTREPARPRHPRADEGLRRAARAARDERRHRPPVPRGAGAGRVISQMIASALRAIAASSATKSG